MVRSHSPKKIVELAKGRCAPYFAYFDPNRKERACFLAFHVIAPPESAVLSQPISEMSNASHLNQVLELLRTLMEYRSGEVRQRLEKVEREASMLHVEVLPPIYHFACSGTGNVLEISPCIGGSTIAAAFGAHDFGKRKEIVTIETGGSVKHFRLSSRNIIKDLKKNLARFGAAEDVTLINGRSSDEAIISEVHQCFGSRDG